MPPFETSSGAPLTARQLQAVTSQAPVPRVQMQLVQLDPSRCHRRCAIDVVPKRRRGCHRRAVARVSQEKLLEILAILRVVTRKLKVPESWARII